MRKIRDNLFSKSLSCLAALSFLVSGVLPVAPAYAGPQDGVVSAGSATINTAGTTATIHQTTNKAVIDWRSFDIGAHEHAQFYQPGKSSVTLNRINDIKPSTIDGQLTANGKIILVNPNGMVFGSGAQVNVNSIVATTADTTNADFMSSGETHFGIAGHADARIINNGSITAGKAGLVGLVAPQIENSGVITAQLGEVNMASGDTFTLDMAGDGKISVAVSGDLQNQLVRNSGTISADGGRIYMTAAAAREQVDSLIDNSGILQARSIGKKDGKIVLFAGGSNAVAGNIAEDKGVKTGTSTVLNSGTIDVSGKTNKSKGGYVAILGDNVGLLDESKIKASGKNAAGGEVNIGGGFQGQGPTPTAKAVYAALGSKIEAKADGAKGDGGRVILWSDDTIRFYGEIDAQGGTTAGKGGFAEVSGKQYLDFMPADIRLGGGDLLLDPGDIVICQFGASADAACNPTAAPELIAAGSIFDSGANAISYVNIGDAVTVGSLVNLLQTNAVTIRTNAAGAGNGDITLADALTWVTPRALTLDAHRDITFNAPLNMVSSLTLTAGRDITLNATTTVQHAYLTLDGNLDINATFQSMQVSNLGQLYIMPKTLTHSIGIGDGVIADVTMDAASIANIGAALGGGDFRASHLLAGMFRIGNAAQLGDIYLGDFSYANKMDFRTNGSIGIEGNANIGGTVFYTDDLSINGTLTGISAAGNANLGLMPFNVATSIGLGDGAEASDFFLSSDELSRIQGTFNIWFIGNRDTTGAMDIRQNTWAAHTYFSAGDISINGAQTFTAGKQYAYFMDSLTSSSPLSSVGGNIQFGNRVIGESLGIGDTAIGDVNISDDLLSQIQGTWTGIYFGSLATAGGAAWSHSTGNIHVASPVSFAGKSIYYQSLTGGIDIDAAQHMTNLHLFSALGADISAAVTGTGAGAVNILTASSMGIADEVGVFQMSSASLDYIDTSFSQLRFTGNSANTKTFGAYDWRWSATVFDMAGADVFFTGPQTFAGSVQFGGGNLHIQDSFDGSSTIYFGQSTYGGGTTLGVAGAAGARLLSAASLDNISDNWTSLSFAFAGGVTYDAYDWRWDVIAGGSGVVGNQVFNGAHTFNDHSLTAQVGVGEFIVNDTLTGGAGTITMQVGHNRTLGVAGGAGDMQVSANTLDNIDGFSMMHVRGSGSSANAVTIGEYTNWSMPVTFYANVGDTIFTGAQDFGIHDVTIMSAAIVDIQDDFDGTGTLTMTGAGAGSILHFNNTAAVSGFRILDEDLANIGSDWSLITLGSVAQTGAINIGATTWNSDVLAQTLSGAITFGIGATAVDFGDSDLTIRTNGNTAISGALTGAGDLTYQTQSVGTALTVGTGSTLSDAELNFIGDDWNSFTIGRDTQTGTLGMAAYNNWRWDTTVLSGSGVVTVSGAQNFNGNDFSLLVDSDPTINQTIASTGGTLTLRPYTQSRSIYLGTAGAAGQYNLTSAEITRFTDGWGEIVVGSAALTGSIFMGTHNNWQDPVTVIRDAADNTGAINITGNSAAPFGTNGTFDILAPVLVTASGSISANGYVFYSHDITINPGAGFSTNSYLDDVTWQNVTGGDGTYFYSQAGNDLFALGDVVMGDGSSAYLYATNEAFIEGFVTVGAGGTLTAGAAVAGYINHDLTTGDAGYIEIYNAFLQDDILLDAGAGGSMYIVNIDAGANQLTFGGDGLMYLDGYIVSTDTSLDLSAYHLYNWGGASEINAGTADVTLGNIELESGGTLTVSGAGDLYLGGTINAFWAGDNLDIQRNTFLTADTTINTWGGGFVTLQQVEAGAHSFALYGDGATYLHGNITSTNATLDLQRSLTLETDVLLDAGTADLCLTNVSAGINNLSIGGDGTLYLAGGSITSTDTELDLSSRDIIVVSDSLIDAGMADVTLGNVYIDPTAFGFTVSGGGDLFLSGNITSADVAIVDLQRNLTTTNDVSIDLGGWGGEVYLQQVDTGAHSFALGPSTSAYLSGDILSTGGQIDLRAGFVALMDSVTIEGGTGTIMLGYIDTNINDLLVNGSGQLEFHSEIYADTGSLTFNPNAVLMADAVLYSNTGDITLNGTLDGGFLLQTYTMGDTYFNGDVGLNTALGDVIVYETNNFFAGGFRSASFTQLNGTGMTSFGGGGLSTTGDIDITAWGISGLYSGVNGNLISSGGETHAGVTFQTLNVGGTLAHLTAGNIGAMVGPATQAMANLITVNGVLMPVPVPEFTYDIYLIGYVPSIDPEVPPTAEDPPVDPEDPGEGGGGGSAANLDNGCDVGTAFSRKSPSMKGDISKSGVNIRAENKKGAADFLECMNDSRRSKGDKRAARTSWSTPNLESMQ